MLLDARTLSRPYLERSGVESIVRGHVSGDRNYTAEIHKVLTLECCAGSSSIGIERPTLRAPLLEKVMPDQPCNRRPWRLVNLCGVIPIAADVATHDGLDPAPFEVRLERVRASSNMSRT